VALSNDATTMECACSKQHNNCSNKVLWLHSSAHLLRYMTVACA
jgi:hypothetical protein